MPQYQDQEEKPQLRRPKQIAEMSEEELRNYQERGLEPEGEADIIKPYKQVAQRDLEAEGHGLLSNILGALVPDSPLDVASSLRGNVAAGLRRGAKEIAEDAKHNLPKPSTYGGVSAPNSLDYGKMNKYTPESQALANAKARKKVPLAESMDYSEIKNLRPESTKR